MNDYTHLEEACNRLKILSFDESAPLNKAKILYKIIKIENDIAPSYLINLFQMSNSSDDTFSNLRSVANKKFMIPKPKLNLFKNCLSYSGAFGWNRIPLEIKKIKLA